MTAVLLTGGAGYVGSHACKALRQAGFDPITYDSLRGNAEAVARRHSQSGRRKTG